MLLYHDNILLAPIRAFLFKDSDAPYHQISLRQTPLYLVHLRLPRRNQNDNTSVGPVVLWGTLVGAFPHRCEKILRNVFYLASNRRCPQHGTNQMSTNDENFNPHAQATAQMSSDVASGLQIPHA